MATFFLRIPSHFVYMFNKISWEPHNITSQNDPSGVPQTRILLTCCSEVSYFDGVLVINRLRKSILSCWGLGCGHVQKWPQESRFKHSNDPSGVPQMQSLLNGILVINGLRKLIWSCWGFSCGHGQKWPQELHLNHFEDLPMDIRKSCFRGSI